MSWKSGGALFEEIVKVIDENVSSHGVKVRIYTRMTEVFSDSDCDTLDYAIDWARNDEQALREAFVNAGYWRSYPEYGEHICMKHFQRYHTGDDPVPCPNC